MKRIWLILIILLSLLNITKAQNMQNMREDLAMDLNSIICISNDVWQVDVQRSEAVNKCLFMAYNLASGQIQQPPELFADWGTYTCLLNSGLQDETYYAFLRFDLAGNVRKDMLWANCIFRDPLRTYIMTVLKYCELLQLGLIENVPTNFSDWIPY